MQAIESVVRDRALARRRFLGSAVALGAGTAIGTTLSFPTPGVPLAAQDPLDLTWIREEFLRHPRLSAVQAELTAVLQGVAALQGLARAAEEERRAALAHLERVDRDLRDGDGRLVRVENSSRDHAGRLERVEADRRIAAEWAADVTTRLTRLRAERDDLRGHWLALDGELDAARAAGAPRASSAACFTALPAV